MIYKVRQLQNCRGKEVEYLLYVGNDVNRAYKELEKGNNAKLRCDKRNGNCRAEYILTEIEASQ